MKVYDWDMADDIETKEDVYAFLEAAFEENNLETLLDVLGAIVKSKGMAAIDRKAGLNHENLYKSFSGEENPSFGTVVQVLDTLGFQLSIKQKVSA
jgi:probable addiction module antidote protein